MVFPRSNRPFIFGQQLAHQTAKGLNQRRVRNIALKLVKFPGNKKPFLARQRFIDFLNQGRFTNPRITRHQHHFGGSLAHPFKPGHQGVDLFFTPIEFLGNFKAIGYIGSC
ncbi:hypothetical protein BGP_6340 [Beggiatoa sp. PS]|nr:hypothetical protein BGP_6340 [Beggiatoa sp. PS]